MALLLVPLDGTWTAPAGEAVTDATATAAAVPLRDQVALAISALRGEDPMTLPILAALVATASTFDVTTLTDLVLLVGPLVGLQALREIIAFLRGRGGPRERE